MKRMITLGFLVSMVGTSTVEAQKIYWWGGLEGGMIQRLDADGSNIEDLLVPDNNPEWLTVSVQAGKMFFVDEFSRIWSANLEIPEGETPTTRTDVVHVFTVRDPDGSRTPMSHLRAFDGKLYWRETEHPHKLMRANLDGTNKEQVIEPGCIGESCGQIIAYDILAGGTVPAVSTWGLAVMVLLLGIAATAMIRKRSPA